ncbi:hypothetical protein [Lysinibacillus sp. TE18511]
MNAEQLNAIKEHAASTSFDKAYVKGDPWKGYEVKNESNGIVIAKVPCGTDATFIAHAREDVPALVTEVERLRQQLEKVEGLLGWAHEVLDDVHCYETEVYQEISEYFGEDD